jgi:hypothetical protein
LHHDATDPVKVQEHITRAGMGAESAADSRAAASCSTGGTRSDDTATILAGRRLAELVDAGQASGQIATNRDGRRSPSAGDLSPVTLPELGVDDRRLAEARVIRDAYTDDDLADA